MFRQKFMPVGLVIKKLDKAITHCSDNALASHGITRMQWQSLNAIGRIPQISEQRFVSEMSPFASQEQCQKMLDTFLNKQWLMRDNDTLMLTASGYRLIAEAEESQNQVRTQLMEGISSEEYSNTMTTLERMLNNCDPQPVLEEQKTRKLR